MKTIYTGESRKDFLENWKSINHDLVVPKFGMPAELEFYQRMCTQNRQGFFISNSIEYRIEFVNMGIISPNFKQAANKYIDDGYNYSAKQIPNEYHEFFMQGQRKLMLNAINTCKPDERLIFEAIVDFPYKLEENKPDLFRMLQHIKPFEVDQNCNPVFFLNLFSDITYLKKKEDCTLAIKMPDGKVLFYKFNVCSRTVTDFGSFSEREITLLHLLSQGLSSRQIADILYISPHTVDTHRRNMLEMTNCIDTTALVVYCRMLGIC